MREETKERDIDKFIHLIDSWISSSRIHLFNILSDDIGINSTKIPVLLPSKNTSKILM